MMLISDTAINAISAVVSAVISAAAGLIGVRHGGRITQQAQERATNQKTASAALALSLELNKIEEELSLTAPERLVAGSQYPQVVPKLHRWIEPLVPQLVEQHPTLAHQFTDLEELLLKRFYDGNSLLTSATGLYGAERTMEFVRNEPGSAESFVQDSQRMLAFNTSAHAVALETYRSTDGAVKQLIDSLQIQLHRVASIGRTSSPTGRQLF